MRLFVAVVPAPDVLARLDRLRRPVVPGVRWTTRDQWHVTLRFLGEVDDPAVVVDALQDLGAATAAAMAATTTARLGPRAERLNPTIVSLPVAGLDEVAAAVVSATATLGRPPERRPFRGHLTLARLKGVPAAVARGLVAVPLEAAWEVEGVDVMRSHLSPKGARYESLATVRLG